MRRFVGFARVRCSGTLVSMDAVWMRGSRSRARICGAMVRIMSRISWAQFATTERTDRTITMGKLTVPRARKRNWRGALGKLRFNASCIQMSQCQRVQSA